MKTRLLLTLSILVITAGTIKLSAQINRRSLIPSKTETASALKEALNLGTKRAVNMLSKENGFLLDKEVKILFPPEIQKVDRTLRSVGLGKLADDFVKQMNKGAEEAVKLTTPIMVSAIKSMTFEDATAILMGGEGSATRYFESKTSDSLYFAFRPKVQEVLDEYGITKSYKTLITKYNSMPFVTKANTDLTDYVTRETLEGLFIKLASEENKIRNDAKARTTSLLQRVFGKVNNVK